MHSSTSENRREWCSGIAVFTIIAKFEGFNHFDGMERLLFLGNIGAGELLVVALIILLVFGGAKIPELMKGLGKGVKNFKDGMKDIEEDIKK